MKSKFERKKFIQRNKLSYFIVSFVQGISSLSDLAIQYFLKDYFDLEPYEMSRVLAFIMIPWIVKPFLGLLTDLFPIMGYRRKVYLISCGLIGSLSWLFLSFFAYNLIITIILLTLVNFAFSFASIIGEAIVVELSQLGENFSEYDFSVNKSFSFEKKSTYMDKAKNHVSLFFLFKNMGALLSAFFRGYLIEIVSLRKIFLITSIIPLFILAAGLILVEKRIVVVYKASNVRKTDEYKKSEDHLMISNYHDYFSITTSYDEKKEHLLRIHKESINLRNIYACETRKLSSELEINRKQLVSNFYKFITNKDVYVPAIFSVLLVATPNFTNPFFYYMTNYLRFTPYKLGILSLLTSVGVLIAILSYRFYFKFYSFKPLVSASYLLYFLFTFLAYLLVMRINLDYKIPDFLMCIFAFIFLSILGELAMMPILTLACTLCPKKLEATGYSFFMSAISFGLSLSTFNSSFITSTFNVSAVNFDNLGYFIITCNCLKIVPIIILFFIDDRYFERVKDHYHEEEFGLLKEGHEEFVECLSPSDNIKKVTI